MSCEEHLGEEVAGGSAPVLDESGSSQVSSGSSGSTEGSCSGSGSSDLLNSTSNSPMEKRHNKCVLHQRYRRNTTSVACQTEYTEEYPCLVAISRDMEASSSNSEGTLRLLIQNFKNMSDTVRGPSKRIQGVFWRIMVMPRQHVVQKKGTQKCLGFFLQCCPDAYSDTWSCLASAELRLMSQKSDVPHFTRKTNHNYTAKENDWGYSCFMTWADILDETQGYIKDDKVVLEVTVKSEPPKNILSLAEFQKSIDNWMSLANMQFGRGCIDLAIEANAQALKFCKDKDAETKLRLEEQKNYFIEQKLVESIQRIENAGQGTSRDGEEPSSQTALRQALTANHTRHNQAKNKDKGKKKKQHRSPTPPPSEVRVKDKPTLEQATTVVNDMIIRDHNGEVTKVNVKGGFNMDFLTTSSQNNWRRSRDEEVYASLAKQLEESLEQLQFSGIDTDKDNFVMRYMAEQVVSLQLRSCDLGMDEPRKSWITETHIRHLAENAFEIELQRQVVIKKACDRAAMYQKEVDARPQIPVDEPTLIADLEALGICWHAMDIALLWRDDNKERRMKLIDREARFLDAKIKLFWNEDEATSYWLDDEFCTSERESVVSADSDRQFDGCIKAKRTKRDHLDSCSEACRCTDKPPIGDVCEMGVQTESIPKNSVVKPVPQPVVAQPEVQLPPLPVPALSPPTGRMIKKPTKKAKAAAQREAAKVTVNPGAEQLPMSPPEVSFSAVTASATLQDDDLIEEIVNVVDNEETSVLRPVVPFTLPMEYAMKYSTDVLNGMFQNQRINLAESVFKAVEDHIRRNFIEGKRLGEEACSSAAAAAAAMLPHIPINPEDPANAALTAVARNFVNATRMVVKLARIAEGVKNSNKQKTKKFLATLASMAGMPYAIEPEPPKGSMPPPAIPVYSEEAEVLKKLLNTADKDYMLTEQNQDVEVINKEIARYEFLDCDDVVHLTKAISMIDDKLKSGVKQNHELEKRNEELEKQVKKLEKTLRTETAALKAQYQTEKEKSGSLNRDIKDKNKEIKRLETKANTIATERDEAQDKIKQMQREATATQKKHNEESQKLKKDITSANENRKQAQVEVGKRDVEVRSLQYQVDDYKAQLKKSRSDMEAERQKAASANQAMAAALERAKKAEISMLSQELEAGVAILERAKLDASKQAAAMEEAANNRARSTAEQANYLANKGEWIGIVEKIDGFITKAKAEYTAYIESIQGGKAMSSLPRISVAKPPPPPVVIKVPPIQSVEPTKPTPGVIGTRPQGHVNNTVSPGSRGCNAPGSPILRTNGQTSPVRQHPGAIGTRPNGVPVNGASSAERHLDLPCSSSQLSSSLNGLSPSSDLLGPRVDQNGWDEQNNTWCTNTVPTHQNQNPTSQQSNGMSQFMGGPMNHTRSAFSQPTVWPQQQHQQHQQLQQPQPQPQAQTQAQQQQQMMERQRAYMTQWHVVIDRTMKKLHCDSETAVALVQNYVREHNTAQVFRMTPDDVAEAIYHKRFGDSGSRLPPGAAPGYLQNPMGYVDRQPPPIGGPQLASMLNNQDHVLNGGLSSLLGSSMNGMNGSIGIGSMNQGSNDKWN